MAKYKFEDSFSRPVFLKDSVVTKVLSDKENKDYLLRIIRAAFKDEDIFKSNDFEFVDIRIGTKESYVQSEADIVIEDEEIVLNIEVNYQISRNKKTDNKNMSYILCLILKQLKRGKREYERIKPVYQLNLNLYDQFGKGKFIYKSVLMEKDLHMVRNETLVITDINLDYLLKLDYDYVKNLSDDSLEKCLYLLTCNDRDKLDELYLGDDLMERVKGQLYDLFENLDEYLFYDHEELKREVSYDEGKEAGFKDGFKDGTEQAHKEMILKLLETGMSKEELSSRLDICLERIEEIISHKDKEEES